MQEIGGALEHLDLAAEAEKDIITQITEAVETLTRNSMSLTTKLSDALNINLEMAKKLNLKAIHTPEDTQMVDTSNRKTAFERNLDS